MLPESNPDKALCSYCKLYRFFDYSFNAYVSCFVSFIFSTFL